ncbi:MAG TPA: glycerate kinase [Firmicutes bacterium]|nr:glycerate kinase [Bacillota bacterium]
MRIVVAPDSFKGSASAVQVGEAMTAGLRKVWPQAEVDMIPLADGGQGTVEAMVRATGGKTRTVRVTGPLGEPADAMYGILPDGTVVIEMAQASGLTLVEPVRRNPLRTTTYGTGELIRHALDSGAPSIILGISGSATNDGGAGMAQALGVGLYDAEGKEIGFGGEELAKLHSVDLTRLHPGVHTASIVVACDVDNPLCGPAGASATYGPQKGATPEMVEKLERALSHFADVVEAKLGQSFRDVPGAGAAGGLGFGLMAFLGAKLQPGIKILAAATRLEERVRRADLVFTGEGQMDWQTAHGKTVAGVASIAYSWGVPVVVISGGLASGHESLYDRGVAAMLSILPGPMSLSESMAQATLLIEAAAERAARLIEVGRLSVKGQTQQHT